MKKNPRLLSIIFAIASIVCIIAGISLLAQKEIGPAVLALTFGAALGYFAYRKYILLPKDAENTTTANAPASNPIRTENNGKPQFTAEMFAVAGVTFNNDDGSNRQKILKEILDKEGVCCCIDAEFEQYLYKNEPAIRVNTSFGCVGNIRKSDIPRVLEIMTNYTPIYVSIMPEEFIGDDEKSTYRVDVSISYPNKD